MVTENRGKGAGLPHDPTVKTVGNDPEKRYRGGKGCEARINERVNVCYGYILEGGTRRQIAQRIADRFNVSERTAHNDYRMAMELVKTEQIETRDNLLNQIQGLRLATVRKALAKGQYQTVAILLKDMGAVIGEVAPEVQALNAPVLNITVEESRKPELSAAAGAPLDVAALPVCEELQQKEPGPG
jgi:hypothetical protein